MTRYTVGVPIIKYETWFVQADNHEDALAAVIHRYERADTIEALEDMPTFGQELAPYGEGACGAFAYTVNATGEPETLRYLGVDPDTMQVTESDTIRVHDEDPLLGTLDN